MLLSALDRACSWRSNASRPPFKVAKLIRIFQALIIEQKTFDYVFAQLPEAGCGMALYAIAHRDNGIRVVVLQAAFYLAYTFLANY
ncbi:hypothetical protein PSCICL_08010 [Pseudomonas cichorii]|nr:hypothetical protein PSCICL_08010 [Pseudomonas cichorii]